MNWLAIRIITKKAIGLLKHLPTCTTMPKYKLLAMKTMLILLVGEEIACW